ncbi:E3 ubiquitin-protein ligase RHA1B-like [Vigna unguiculata]|uniref:E3 ubiquitin-protein ligase n=1 Tax=Vigna unguiculata TaxID=3917 RepID=A0A4D6NHA7_VIGUN|nr:E3 ubiquitin-protein ligase RHA1B-like [Vigna unguiculata]QCE12351.1 E3 ubiquitin-protein ligase [Vigna unguiculata]
MGFPVGYPEVLVPKLFLHALSLLAWLRSLVAALFRLLHLSDLLDTDASALAWPPESQPPRAPTLSALLIREFLPVTAFRDLDDAGESPPSPTGCAVCLSEFCAEEEIRCMANCKHMFHRACVDRWIDHDQKTCPLCRTPFVPEHKVEEYNQRLWAASGVSQFYQDDYTPSL